MLLVSNRPQLKVPRPTRPNATVTVWTQSWTGSPACCPSPKRSSRAWTNFPSWDSASASCGPRASSLVGKHTVINYTYTVVTASSAFTLLMLEIETHRSGMQISYLSVLKHLLASPSPPTETAFLTSLSSCRHTSREMCRSEMVSAEKERRS